MYERFGQIGLMVYREKSEAAETSMISVSETFLNVRSGSGEESSSPVF